MYRRHEVKVEVAAERAVVVEAHESLPDKTVEEAAVRHACREGLLRAPDAVKARRMGDAPSRTPDVVLHAEVARATHRGS